MATGDTLTIGAGWGGATSAPASISFSTDIDVVDTGAGNDITVVDSMAALDTVFPFVVQSPKTFRIFVASGARITANDPAPTGGTYTLTVGAETTAPIAYNATAAAIKSALELLSGVTTATVAYEGGSSLGVKDASVTIILDNNAPALTANLTGLTGGTATFDKSVNTGDIFTLYVRSTPESANYAIVQHTATAGQVAEDIAAALATAWNAHIDPLVSDRTASHTSGNTYFDVAAPASIHALYIQARPDNQTSDNFGSSNIWLQLIEDPPAPLMPRTVYWARRSSTTELKVYNTEDDATAQRNEVFLQDSGGAGTHLLEYFGSDCSPIMAWTRPQNIDISSTFKIGVDVSGFVHEWGGGTVEFSVNNGPWVEADTRTRNDQRALHADSTISSGSTEYWVTIDPTGQAAGTALEVRCRWTPTKIGKAKVLQGTYVAALDSAIVAGSNLYNNNFSYYCRANSTPQTIELANGNYTWGSGPLSFTQTDSSEWLTIRPAPGASKANVIINADNGIGPTINRVRLQGLTINGPDILSGFGSADMWLDDVDWTTTATTPRSQSVRRMFQTRSKLDGVRTGCRHWSDGCVYVNIREDVFQYLNFLNDADVQSLNTVPGGHPAVIANPTGYNNRLIRQLVTSNTITAKVFALRQGVSNTTPAQYAHIDVAIVDCVCPRSASSSSQFAFFGGLAHNFYWGNNDFLNSNGSLAYRAAVHLGESSVPGYWRSQPNAVVYDSVDWGTPPDASVPGTSFVGVIVRGENFSTWTETDLNWDTGDTTTAASTLSVSGSTVTITDSQRKHVGHVSKDFGDQHFFQNSETFIGRFQFAVFQSARYAAVLAFGDDTGNLDDGTAAFKLNNAIVLSMGLHRDPGGTDSYERGLHLTEYVNGSDIDSTYSRATTDVADTGYPAAGTLDPIADASDNAGGYFKWVFDPSTGTHGRHTVYVYATLADLEADTNELTGGNFWLEPTTSQSASGGPNRYAMVANGRGDNTTTVDSGTAALQGLVADIDLTYGQVPLTVDVEPSIDDDTLEPSQLANITGPEVSGGVPPYTYNWTKQSGTGTLTFGTPSSKNTSVTTADEDSFVARCTVSDSDTPANTLTSDVAFTVAASAPSGSTSSSTSTSTQVEPPAYNPPVPPRSTNLAVSGIAAAIRNGTWQSGPHAGQSVRALLIGDSITNPNTNAGGNEANQDSYTWGIIRTWATEWSGFTSATNSAFPDMAYAADAISGLTRIYGYANQNSPTVSSGDANFSLRIPIELRFSSDDTGTGTWFQQRWETGGAWADKFWVSEAMNAELWYFRTPETPDSIELTFQHQGTGGNQVVATRTGCAGSATPAKLDFPQPNPGNSIIRANVSQATGYNEASKDLIIYGIHARKRTGTGFELSAHGVGGAKYENYIDTDKFITDPHLAALHGPDGVYTPNLLMITLGANDGSNLTLADMTALVERYGSLIPNLYILFLTPYGTPSSISQSAALAQAEKARQLAVTGTTSVPSSHIAVINTPQILGVAEASDLVDTIHPKRSFVTEVTTAWWDQMGSLNGDESASRTGSSRRSGSLAASIRSATGRNLRRTR